METSLTRSVDDVREPPEPARVLRDFVNTREPQTGDELFTDPDAVATWCAAHGLLPAGESLGDDDVALVVAVREGLRAGLQGHAGHGAPVAALADLETALREVPLRASLDASGDLVLSSASAAAVGTVLGRIVEAVRQSSVDGSWSRLKVCGKDSCRWAFYDTSRNRSGRWCSMAGCGNQVKMQRAYARRRGAAGG